MSVPLILAAILFALMAAFGGGRGVKAFLTLLFNFFVLYVLLFMIGYGLDPLWVTVGASLLITAFVLFYINGPHRKTAAAMISVTVTAALILGLVWGMSTAAHIQGFGKEEFEDIAPLSLVVNVDFSGLVICVLLLGLLGAVMDVAVSISSSMSELHRSEPGMGRAALFRSGMNIGRDILGTMTNTLLFAYAGGGMTLMIWFAMYRYTPAEIFNDKLFCSEVFQLLAGGIGIILVIPVTACVTAGLLYTGLPRKPHRFAGRKRP